MARNSSQNPGAQHPFHAITSNASDHGRARMIFDKVKTHPGNYILIIRVPEPTTIQIGRLGAVHFMPGYFAYIGSAKGPGGLQARLRRHLRPRNEKRAHWHIDYLTSRFMIEELWWMAVMGNKECSWAEVLLKTGNLAAPKFGASDCRCPGHLIGLGDRESVINGWHNLSRFAGAQLMRVRIGSQTDNNLLQMKG